MQTTHTRCKSCGKPITQDEQQNFSSYCYGCFKEYRLSKMRKGTAMKIIGIIGLIFVCLIYIPMVLFILPIFRTPGIVASIIGNIIAIAIPIILIFNGIKKEKQWETTPREPQITSPTLRSSADSAQKFCPECGNKIIDPHQKFCLNCGTKIHS